MKKIFVFLLGILFLVPSLSYAETTPQTNTELMQLIATLTERVNSLIAELNKQQGLEDRITRIENDGCDTKPHFEVDADKNTIYSVLRSNKSGVNFAIGTTKEERSTIHFTMDVPSCKNVREDEISYYIDPPGKDTASLPKQFCRITNTTPPYKTECVQNPITSGSIPLEWKSNANKEVDFKLNDTNFSGTGDYTVHFQYGDLSDEVKVKVRND